MRRIPLLLLAAMVATGLGAITPAHAVDYDLTFGGAYAAAANAVGSDTEAYSGADSWYKSSVSPKFELYIDPATQLGGTFTVGQIQAIRYRTHNDGTNPSGVDFYLQIYTQPYTGGDATWYGNRLNAEPLYSNGYAPLVNAWTEWTTDPGANQLTFFDGNHTTNFGFYGGPTLQDITSGPITWTDYPGAGGGSDPTPIDYASQPVLYLNIATGSGWSSIVSYIDAIEVDLTTGDTFTIDLEDYVDEVWVDDDWAGSGVGVEVEPGKFFGHNAFDTVQGGVDNVVGSTVNVAPGTYEEQVVIDGMDVELIGSGIGSTVIASPDTLDAFFSTGSNDNYPVILATNSPNIVIRDLTVDGQSKGNVNYRFQGVGFYEAGGALLDAEVLNIQDTPFSGSQHGVGVYAYNISGGPYAIEVGNVLVDAFQKTAVALSGAGLTADVHDVACAGVGPTTVTAQNGIQIGFDADATITDCTVADVEYTPSTYTASGLLFYQGGTVDVAGTVVNDCQTPVYYQDTNGSIDGTEVNGGGQWDGVTVYNTTASKGTISSSPDLSRGVAQPFDEGLPSAPSATGVFSMAAAMSVTISNSCFTGSGVTGSWGIDSFSSGAPTTVVATNNTVTGYDVGMATYGAAATLTANDNSLAGNAVSGYDNVNSGSPQDATNNWWGAADGPSGDGAGSGVAVVSVGGEVDFDPFRISGSSSTPCAFTPDPASNEVDPVADPCISTVNPCASVSFDITRSDAASMRGFSVTFELSPELELCNGMLSDIVEGTYLNSISATSMQVLDNGGGSYTVDVAILGLPCGATAPTGTLFTVNVGASGGDGTGTVDVTSLTFRDCNNVPIAAGTGGSTLITIDTAGPAAVADLAASQVKTGNDTDGTSKAEVTFTLPGDAVALTVYTKGFGDYPEYDDLSGAVPTTPATPGAALGDGWTAVGSITASGDFHEETSRDFWYYVIFTEDVCGNVSAVSNMTDGTLGYHLGDVTDGVTPGTGDNAVDTPFDIGALGAAYGTIDGDLDYKNYIDVGPTTDFSVDALPTTDDQIQFEDLIMFAINHGQVSKPAVAEPADRNALTAHVPAAPVSGSFDVTLELASRGDVQGLSIPLTWDPAVVTPVNTLPGSLLDEQAGRGMVFVPEAGTVDAAVFGSPFQGEGTLATVRFRVLAAGDPKIGIGEVTARDAENRPVALEGVTQSGDGRDIGTPATTRLLPMSPNPFRAGTNIAFSLATPGQVSIRVYSADGRLVRSLLDAPMPSGDNRVAWDGMDQLGRRVASGSYVIRFETPDMVDSRQVVRLP